MKNLLKALRSNITSLFLIVVYTKRKKSAEKLCAVAFEELKSATGASEYRALKTYKALEAEVASYAERLALL